MSPANKAIVFFMVGSLGLWGCTKEPGANGSANLEQIKSLETRIAKLEEDFRAAAAARDQFRQKLATVEDQRTKLEKAGEDLKNQLAARTTERDNLQNQYEAFRKNIRDLVGQAEAAAGQPPAVISAMNAQTPGKS